MKLKKIVSLAMAGVLAVSMLAGCKTATPNDGAASSEETATATGYSAMLADEMKDLAGKDYITFKDNGSNVTALKFAVTTVANGSTLTNISTTTNAGVFRLNSTHGISNAFVEKAELDKSLGTDAFGTSDNDAKAHLNGTFSYGIVYAAEGTINMETVMATIAKDLETDRGFTVGASGNLKETVATAPAASGSTYDMSYEISVSVVNVPNTTNLQVNQSVNFVAVSITRTGVDA